MNYASVLSAAQDLSQSDQSQLVRVLSTSLHAEPDRNLPKTSSNSRKKEFTVAQAARALSVSTNTISRWFDCGKLKGYRFPSRRAARIKAADLISYLKAEGIDHSGVPRGERHAFTTSQAAKIVGVNSRTILRRMNLGQIKGYYIQGTQERRIYGESLRKMAQEQGIEIRNAA